MEGNGFTEDEIRDAYHHTSTNEKESVIDRMMNQLNQSPIGPDVWVLYGCVVRQMCDWYGDGKGATYIPMLTVPEAREIARRVIARHLRKDLASKTIAEVDRELADHTRGYSDE